MLKTVSAAATGTIGPLSNGPNFVGARSQSLRTNGSDGFRIALGSQVANGDAERTMSSTSEALAHLLMRQMVEALIPKDGVRGGASGLGADISRSMLVDAISNASVLSRSITSLTDTATAIAQVEDE